MPTTRSTGDHPKYELLYHAGLPGRGEYIRLAFEAAGVPYEDVANRTKNGSSQVYSQLGTTGDKDGNPPIFAPPFLRVPGAGKDGKALVISQTPNILLYIGQKIGLVPDESAAGEGGLYYVNELALTALDWGNETHDTHHPVAVMDYYEDQKQEALRKAKDFRENRIPKFVGYFENVLKGNEGLGKGRFLVGDRLTYADTTFWQVLDGVKFAFPKEMKAREKEFPLVFGTFYPSLKEQENVKAYLASDRRLAYGNGIFRHYPELDRN